MADRMGRGRIGRWVGAAAVLGLVAGFGAVYVSEQGAGNGADGECAAAVDVAGRLKPLVKGEIAALIPAERPVSLASLSFLTETGAPTTLADFAGRTLLVNLWATWCAPCRAEMPALDRLAGSLDPAKAEVVAVNLDIGNFDKAEAFLAETGVARLGRWQDPKMGIFNELKQMGLAFGLPTTLLVDDTGCLLGVMHGPAEWDAPEAAAVIAAAG